MRAFFILLFASCLVSKGFAHEVRPAYLGITQENDSIYHILWKIPAMGDQTPKIYPEFPEDWKLEKSNARLIPGAVRREWIMTSKSQLNGNKIFIDGLASTIIDVLINIKLSNGEHYSQIISANEPFYIIPDEPSASNVIWTYLKLGVDHIIFGFDHLLFVLGLILVTSGKWKIIKTVTSFTIAHSITLSLAALGYASIPIAPVEAIIALSIVFLGKEILQHKEGEDSLTYRKPWLIAFVFGLLHGFGFASALSETGLPQMDIPLALAFFNVGVEVGQIGFVLVVFALIKALSLVKMQWPVWIKKMPSYLIGGMASYWLFDRVIGFW